MPDACDAWRDALTKAEVEALGWEFVCGGWRKHFNYVPVVVFWHHDPRRAAVKRGGFDLVYEIDDEEHDRHWHSTLWDAVQAAETRFAAAVA